VCVCSLTSPSDTTTARGFLSSVPDNSRFLHVWRNASNYSVLASLNHILLHLSIYSLVAVWFLTSCSLTYPACKAHGDVLLSSVSCLAVLYFVHYLMNGANLEKKLLDIKCIEKRETNLMSLAFLFQLLNAQHVSDVNTSILRSFRLICWVISWVVLLWYDVCWCYVVVWLGLCGILMQAEALVPQPA